MKIKHGKIVYDVEIIADYADAIVILTGANNTPKALLRNEFSVVVSTESEDNDLETMKMIEESLNNYNVTYKVYAKKAIKLKAVADYYNHLKLKNIINRGLNLGGVSTTHF
jgi:hypothetical protein